jgi:diamine N-acetyltransferase
MNSPTQFRFATADDALCISGLAMHVYLDTYMQDGMRPDLAHQLLTVCSPQSFAEQLAEPNSHFILAERNGHLVAFAHYALHRTPPEVGVDGLQGSTELARLYVQRFFKGQGIGRELLEQVEAQARASGAAALWLTTWADNTAARAFYAKQGYADIGETRYVFEDRSYESRVLARRF